MIRLENFSVRGKIILLIGTGILLQIGIAVLGMYYIHNLNNNIKEMVAVEAEANLKAARVITGFLDLIINEKNMVMSRVETDRSRLRFAFDSQRRDLETHLSQLQAVIPEDKKEDIGKFAIAYRQFLLTHQRIRELTDRDKDQEAMKLSIGDARAQVNQAHLSLVALMDDLGTVMVQRDRETDKATQTALSFMVGILLFTAILSIGLGLVVTRTITTGLGKMVAVADAIAAGNLDNRIEITGRDEVARLTGSVAAMQDSLKKARDEGAARNWLATSLNHLFDVMREKFTIEDLASAIINEISARIDAKVGTFYVMGEEDTIPCLSLLGTYAYMRRKNLSNRFALGEGLVGQAALERKQILISKVPDDYIKVTSGIGEAVPRQICVSPLIFEGQIKGVIEVATLDTIDDLQLEYLSHAMPAVATNLERVKSRERLQVALEASQQLTEELQVQQEELEASNEELEEQTQQLKDSEERLKAQQEEMEVVNEELEEKNNLLERQKRDVEQARRDIEEQAAELAQASKYKSEFLANMSHELRTPLNSLLLLARSLSENKNGELSKPNVEAARIIYQSGNDLLSLINEILDLSKIEAGRMELTPGDVVVAEIADSIRDAFGHIAAEKKLAFEVTVQDDMPSRFVTDRMRLDQVIRNLAANALKFTEKGGVKINFGTPPSSTDLSKSGLSADRSIAVTVADTGIGITSDQQKVIFEAFKQADGGIARRYGGTGLGLTICRELVRLLKGEIQLKSDPEKGSVFCVFLPLEMSDPSDGEAFPARGADDANFVPSRADVSAAGFRPVAVPDDRDSIIQADSVMLIIEDDIRFAGLLVKQCQERGFKCLVAGSGEEGLELARRHIPRGIILDIKLPGVDGWRVLDTLKGDPVTRHIPIHIISADEPTPDALRKGAVGYMRKPVTHEQIDDVLKKIEDTALRRVKNVLVVEDNDEMRQSILALIADDQVLVDEATGANQALAALQAKRYDCMILDLGLWDMDGDQLLKQAEKQDGIALPPVIVYTARDLTREEETSLRGYSDSIIIKDVRSQERLFDEVSLFLHRVVAEMPERKRQVIADLYDIEAMFRDRKVLIVDDDMRTVFALSSLLSDRGMQTLKAENGEKALKLLDRNPDTDLVLMDVMMPVLDGIETIRRIRAQERFHQLPVIALTAKVMKGDREQCMAAGANDYLPKPVNQDRLISMLRVWLHR